MTAAEYRRRTRPVYIDGEQIRRGMLVRYEHRPYVVWSVSMGSISLCGGIAAPEWYDETVPREKFRCIHIEGWPMPL